MINKLERFEIRLEQGTLDRLDSWRFSQENMPSRAEAMRQLIDVGLDRKISLTPGDKLTLMMLCDILKHINIKNGIDYKFIQEAIYGGHYWGFDWGFKGLFHGHEDNPKNVTEVFDILEMWEDLEEGYEKLSITEKENIKKETPFVGDSLEFYGFDGNNESEWLGIAEFIIKHLGRYPQFANRNLNSHMYSLDIYRRMLPIYQRFKARFKPRDRLNADQIIQILKVI